MRCFRCPIAYHSGDGCIAAGSLFVSSHILICSNHSKRTHSSSAVNVGFCFVCARGEHTCFFPCFIVLWSLVQLSDKILYFMKNSSLGALGDLNAAWDFNFCFILFRLTVLMRFPLAVLVCNSWFSETAVGTGKVVLVLPVGKSGCQAPSCGRCRLRMGAVVLLTVC